jgi:hypothetical protein
MMLPPWKLLMQISATLVLQRALSPIQLNLLPRLPRLPHLTVT